MRRGTEQKDTTWHVQKPGDTALSPASFVVDDDTEARAPRIRD